MTTPTEAQIREAIGSPDHLVDADMTRDLRATIAPLLDSDQALVRAGWMEDFYPDVDHPGTLWADLRPSETEELHDAIHGAIRAVERIAADMLVERLVAVGLAFAAAHPDIPRGHWPNGWHDDAPREPPAT